MLVDIKYFVLWAYHMYNGWMVVCKSNLAKYRRVIIKPSLRVFSKKFYSFAIIFSKLGKTYTFGLFNLLVWLTTLLSHTIRVMCVLISIYNLLTTPNSTLESFSNQFYLYSQGFCKKLESHV